MLVKRVLFLLNAPIYVCVCVCVCVYIYICIYICIYIYIYIYYLKYYLLWPCFPQFQVQCISKKKTAAGVNWLFGFFRPPREISRRSAVLSLKASSRVSPEHTAERFSVTVTEVFRDFFQLKANARAHDAKSGHGPHFPP